jgi:hypothetical protein
VSIAPPLLAILCGSFFSYSTGNRNVLCLTLLLGNELVVIFDSIFDIPNAKRQTMEEVVVVSLDLLSFFCFLQ